MRAMAAAWMRVLVRMVVSLSWCGCCQDARRNCFLYRDSLIWVVVLDVGVDGCLAWVVRQGDWAVWTLNRTGRRVRVTPVRFFGPDCSESNGSVTTPLWSLGFSGAETRFL